MSGSKPDGSADRSLTVAAPLDSVPATEPLIPPSAVAPRAYFITFATYGNWLHGDDAGSVDRQHNVFGTLVVKPNHLREKFERKCMTQPRYEMDAPRRDTVLAAIREVCIHRVWWLFVAHVRATHVHAVVQAGNPPEKVMIDFKCYASRDLNRAGFESNERKRWARHGSTRYLWTEKDLEGAIHYVLYEQGKPMAAYAAPGARRE